LTLESRGDPGGTREIGVVVAASCFLVLSAMFVQYVRGEHSPENRFVAAAVWFDNREPPLLATYNGLVRQAHANELTDAEFANWLDAEILPFYSEARSRLAWNPESAGPFDDTRRLVNRYLELRGKSYLVLADALRTGNREMVDEAMRIQRESDLLAQEMYAGAGEDAASAVP
jgi:hypothetical protein